MKTLMIILLGMILIAAGVILVSIGFQQFRNNMALKSYKSWALDKDNAEVYAEALKNKRIQKHQEAMLQGMW